MENKFIPMEYDVMKMRDDLKSFADTDDIKSLIDAGRADEYHIGLMIIFGSKEESVQHKLPYAAFLYEKLSANINAGKTPKSISPLNYAKISHITRTAMLNAKKAVKYIENASEPKAYLVEYLCDGKPRQSTYFDFDTALDVLIYTNEPQYYAVDVLGDNTNVICELNKQGDITDVYGTLNGETLYGLCNINWDYSFPSPFKYGDLVVADEAYYGCMAGIYMFVRMYEGTKAMVAWIDRTEESVILRKFVMSVLQLRKYDGRCDSEVCIIKYIIGENEEQRDLIQLETK